MVFELASELFTRHALTGKMLIGYNVLIKMIVSNLLYLYAIYLSPSRQLYHLAIIFLCHQPLYNVLSNPFFCRIRGDVLDVTDCGSRGRQS